VLIKTMKDQVVEQEIRKASQNEQIARIEAQYGDLDNIEMVKK